MGLYSSFESNPHIATPHITMYKLIVFAVVLVAASAQVALPAVPAGLPVAHAGLPYPYAAGVHHPYAIAPAGYALPAPVAANYVLPPAREVVEAPLVAQTVEKVEQHGYSIRY